MTEVADRPRIDPRFARRWIDARRQEGRRRLRLLVFLGVVIAAAGLAVGSLWTPLLVVRNVRATVDGPIAADQITRLAGLVPPPLMIDVHTGSAAARLDADPWLGAARVQREWPGTVRIQVTVRTPVAQAAAGPAGWAQLDRTGRVLTFYPQRTPALPEIDGAGDVPAAGGWLAGSPGPAAPPGGPSATGPVGADMGAASDGPDVPRGVTAALAVLASLPTSARAEVTAVEIGPYRAGTVDLPAGALGMTVTAPALPGAASGPAPAGGSASAASGGTAGGTVPGGGAAGGSATGGGGTATSGPGGAGGPGIFVLLGDGSQLAAKVSALVTMLGQADLSKVSSIDLTVPDRPAAVTTGSLDGAPRRG